MQILQATSTASSTLRSSSSRIRTHHAWSTRHEEDDLQNCEQHKFIEINATGGITGAFSACFSDHKPLEKE